MAELDNLLGSKISLITTDDIRYDGTLFSINAQESSIVLQDVRTVGTEDRVTDLSRQVPSSNEVHFFASFPGNEIKDLIVHEPVVPVAVTLNESKQTPKGPPRNRQPARGEGRGRGRSEGENTANVQNVQPQRARQPPREPVVNPHSAGTGEHLLKLRVKKNADSQGNEIDADVTAAFDFEAALGNFNKDEVLAKVLAEREELRVTEENKYKKDDFFDSISNDAAARNTEGQAQRRTQAEERNLNQDTFGAVALQSNNYRRGGYRGGGRGGRGRGGVEGEGGRGRGGVRGRGQGRGYPQTPMPSM